MQQQQQQASLYEGSPTGSELEGGGGGSPLKAPTTLATRFFTQAAAAAAKLSSATAPRPGCSSNSSTTQQQQPVVRRVLQVPPIHRSSSIYAAPSEASPHSASSSDSPSLLRVQSQHKGEDSHTSIVDLQHHNGVHVAVEQFVRRGRSSTSTSAGGAGRGPGGCGGGAGGSDGGGGGKDTFWPCTFNLSKVILGAGMMAIPRAFMLLGLLPGSAVMLLMALLTFFTLASLVSATAGVSSSDSSSSSDGHEPATAAAAAAASGGHLAPPPASRSFTAAATNGAHNTRSFSMRSNNNNNSNNSSSSGGGCRQVSYSTLVRATLGAGADRVLAVAVLINCYVMNVVFVVILGDILIGGEPDFAGLLPELSGRDPRTTLWLRRDVVLGAISGCVLLPLASLRSMERLAVVNIIGVACNGLFAALLLALAASAAANGVLQPPPLLPDWSQLGTTPLTAAVAIAAVVPVLLNCDVCHQSLHPLMPLLQPYSVARMQRLVGLALAICNAVYMTVTICSGLVFGAALAPDVLSNVTTAAMAPLIGPRAAAAASACVRLGYLLSLIGSFVLLCYPLRQCVGDMLLPGGQGAVQRHWLGLTTLLVASCTAIATELPSIWGALALVGATASVVQAFVIPGLVVLSVERTAAAHAARRASAAAAAAAGRSVRADVRRGGEGDDVRQPLLAAACARADDEGVAADAAEAGASVREGQAAATSEAAAAAPAAAAARPSAAWQRLLRQAAAVLCVAIGVGLFANSVVGAMWDATHPRAEGSARAGLLQVYRLVLRPPL